MKKVEIYTDGACTGNPGKGGFGAVLIYNGVEKEISKGFRKTTNNRMELLGAINGLEALKEPCSVTLTSDSKYLVDAFNEGWIYAWRDKGWHKSGGLKNPDLWERIYELTEIHKVKFVWIKGHNGHEYNERCDRLATAYADSFNIIPSTDLGENDV